MSHAGTNSENNMADDNFVDALESIELGRPAQVSTGTQVGTSSSYGMPATGEPAAGYDVLDEALREFDQPMSCFDDDNGEDDEGNQDDEHGEDPPIVEANQRRVDSQHDKYWVIMFNDNGSTIDWAQLFYRKIAGGKSFRVQIVVHYVKGGRLTGEPYVRKRPEDDMGRLALRNEAINIKALAEDLKSKKISINETHIAELKARIKRASKKNRYNVESTYWKLYNLGSLRGILQPLQSETVSKDALPVMAARFVKHMLIALKSTLVTPTKGLLHDDIVSSNIFVHLSPRGKEKLPDFYLGDWGDSVFLTAVMPRLEGVQESIKRVAKILNDFQGQPPADSGVYDQLLSALGETCADPPASELDILGWLAERLDKTVDTVAKLEVSGMEAAAGSIDSVYRILKKLEIVAEPTRFDTLEHGHQAAESDLLDHYILQLVEKNEIDFTKGWDPNEDSSSGSEPTLKSSSD